MLLSAVIIALAWTIIDPISHIAHASSGELSLDPELIEQRINQNGQTTNELSIEILTTESGELDAKIKTDEETKLYETKNGLFIGKYDGSSGNSVVLPWLFSNVNKYYGTAVDSSGGSWVDTVILTPMTVHVTRHGQMALWIT